MQPIYYTALFVDDTEAVFSVFPPVHKNKVGHHCTITFKPENLEGIEVGRKHKLKVLARVFDDKGDALLVECHRSTKKFPHITLSHADGADRNYSNEMVENAAHKIEYLKQEVFIDVTEGYHDGKVVIKA